MNRVVKVLAVYQHLPHYRSEVFAELQLDPFVEWTFAADLASSDRSIPTIPPHQFPRFRRLRNHWRGPILWQSGLMRLLLRERFDAIVFLGDAAYLSTWVGAMVARICRRKVLFWTIGWHRPDVGPRRLVRLCFYRLAHMLLLYGATGKRIGVSLGYPEGRMRVVGNSKSSHRVDTPDAPSHDGWLPCPDETVVTAVVRLTPLKGLHLLVRAIAQLNASHPRNIVLILAGAGPERDALRALAANLGVDLRLPGAVYSSEALATIYARTTVTVVPLNAGLTCIQSLSYGRPVITTDDPYQWAPETEAIVPGVTGGYYADGSVSSLATVIEDWIIRMREDKDSVEVACRSEIERRWTATAQAASIASAISVLTSDRYLRV